METTVDLIKTSVDYGALGLMVGVLLYAVRKLGVYVFNNNNDVHKISDTLDSLSKLIDSVDKQYSFMFSEYKSMLESERSKNTALSEKFFNLLSEFDKDSKIWRSENLSLLNDLRQSLNDIKGKLDGK